MEGRTVFAARARERVRTKTETNLHYTLNVINSVLFVPFIRIVGSRTWKSLTSALHGQAATNRLDTTLWPLYAQPYYKRMDSEVLLWHFWDKIRHYLNTIKRCKDTDFSNNLKVTRHCERNICTYVEYFLTVFSVGQLLFLSWFRCKFLDKMVFTSQTHLLLLYLMYYSGNMFRLVTESSSGPYIKIQILNLL